MILKWDQSASMQLPKKEATPIKTRKQSFRSALIQKNNHLLQKIQKNQQQEQKRKLLDEEGLKALKMISQENVQINIADFPHGFHSIYSPLRNSNYWGEENQLNRCFPYLADLDRNDCDETAERCWRKIKQFLSKEHDKSGLLNQSDYEFKWSICQQKFNPSLSFSDKLTILEKYLKFGIRSHDIEDTKSMDDLESLLFTLNHAKCILQPNNRINHNVTVTLQSNENICLSTFQKTMKTLFCPICLIYDCHYHDFDFSKEISTSYISHKNLINSQKHSDRAIQLITLYQAISKNNSNLQIKTQTNNELCSENCYKRFLSSEDFSKHSMHLQNKTATISPISRLFIKMGINIYSYDPCSIYKLLGINPSVDCELIFMYFMIQLNLNNIFQFKMCSSEIDMLQNCERKQESIPPKISKNKSKFKFSIKKKKNINKKLQKISKFVCFHHEIDKESKDLNCTSCDCRIRGFCVPECLCSENCPIKKLGCKCKASKEDKCCKNQKCPCFKRETECIPGVCSGCFPINDISQCENYPVLLRKKKHLRIGCSSVESAGLGLFAGEPIKKGQFVTLYLGEKVDPLVEQMRQIYRKDQSFYNFETSELTLDAKYIGNKARFINHAENGNQNLTVCKIVSMGEEWVTFFAIRNIAEHEELFFDYDGSGQLAIHHGDKYPFISKKQDKI